MTASEGILDLLGDIFQGVFLVLLVVLFAVGLVYRLHHWVTTVDEKAAQKEARRREQLRRTVRRPARDVPVAEADDLALADSDPALNEEEAS